MEAGIPSVGPTKMLARLETSKSFTRELLQKYKIRATRSSGPFHPSRVSTNF